MLGISAIAQLALAQLPDDLFPAAVTSGHWQGDWEPARPRAHVLLSACEVTHDCADIRVHAGMPPKPEYRPEERTGYLGATEASDTAAVGLETDCRVSLNAPEVFTDKALLSWCLPAHATVKTSEMHDEATIRAHARFDDDEEILRVFGSILSQQYAASKK